MPTKLSEYLVLEIPPRASKPPFVAMSCGLGDFKNEVANVIASISEQTAVRMEGDGIPSVKLYDADAVLEAISPLAAARGLNAYPQPKGEHYCVIFA